MTNFDIQYRNLAEDILTNGKEYLTRATDPLTGKRLKAKKLFHKGFRFDLEEGFPILTTKRMPKSKSHPENGFLFASEMFWIWVLGSNVVEDLRDLGNNVWNEWEIKEGNWAGSIGPAYGYQARQLMAPQIDSRTGKYLCDIRIDQVQDLIDGLIKDPQGRRHIVTFWHVPDLPEMGLPPCAFQTIWDVDDGRLNCHLIQRSGDYFLGVPFNVSQYAMLTHMIAQAVGLKPGILAHDITNVHIYENHYDLIEKQMGRKPKDCTPKLWIDPTITDFNDFKLTDVAVLDYESHPGIKGGIGV
jgi:thymidylate synthase